MDTSYAITACALLVGLCLGMVARVSASGMTPSHRLLPVDVSTISHPITSLCRDTLIGSIARYATIGVDVVHI